MNGLLGRKSKLDTFVHNCQWVCMLRYSRVNQSEEAALYKQDGVA